MSPLSSLPSFFSSTYPHLPRDTSTHNPTSNASHKLSSFFSFFFPLPPFLKAKGRSHFFELPYSTCFGSSRLPIPIAHTDDQPLFLFQFLFSLQLVLTSTHTDSPYDFSLFSSFSSQTTPLTAQKTDIPHFPWTTLPAQPPPPLTSSLLLPFFLVLIYFIFFSPPTIPILSPSATLTVGHCRLAIQPSMAVQKMGKFPFYFILFSYFYLYFLLF